MKFTVEVPVAGGIKHRVRVDHRGRLACLDHPYTQVRREVILISFGSKENVCPCIKLFEQAVRYASTAGIPYEPKSQNPCKEIAIGRGDLPQFFSELLKPKCSKAIRLWRQWRRFYRPPNRNTLDAMYPQLVNNRLSRLMDEAVFAELVYRGHQVRSRYDEPSHACYFEIKLGDLLPEAHIAYNCYNTRGGAWQDWGLWVYEEQGRWDLWSSDASFHPRWSLSSKYRQQDVGTFADVFEVLCMAHLAKRGKGPRVKQWIEQQRKERACLSVSSSKSSCQPNQKRATKSTRSTSAAKKPSSSSTASSSKGAGRLFRSTTRRRK